MDVPPRPMCDADLVAAVRASDAAHALFAPDQAVVVAVSGGADSVALLAALVAYAPERGLSLHVAHLDHMLRPASADDAAFVARLGRAHGLPVHVEARDVTALAARLGMGLEEAGRTARYAFLAAVAARVGAGVVAVGHTADDQSETVLMRFLRGAGLDGLAGMRARAPYPVDVSAVVDDADGELPAWSRAAGQANGSAGDSPARSRAAGQANGSAGDSPARSRAAGQANGNAGDSPAWPPRLVRPFLGVWRTEIELFLTAGRVDWRQDDTNEDRRFLRNRLRHDVLPALEAINPRLRPALVRTAAALADDLDLVEARVEETWSRIARCAPGQVTLDLGGWSREPAAVRRRLVRRAVAALRGGTYDLGFDHLAAALRLGDAALGAAVSLPGGLRLSRAREALVLAEVPRERSRRVVSEAVAPETLVLETLVLETVVLETVVLETVVPEAVVPEAFVPEAVVPEAVVPLAMPGETDLAGGWAIAAAVRQFEGDDLAPRPDRWTAVLDLDAIGDGLGARPRRPGDRMQPVGMHGHHKRLQDLFVDAHVPREARASWPVVVDGDTVVWLPGLRLDARAAVRPESRRVVVLSARPPARLAGPG